jgi:thiol-disulfide isomerase/thioredoxin
MRRHSLPLIPALFGLLLALCAAPLRAAPELAVGQPAPDFALKSLGGPNVRLSELRGDVVMVNFWATWCGPCRQEMPLLDEIYQHHHAIGFDLLGVNVDDDGDRAAAMVRTLGVGFPILFDSEKTVSRLYRIETMPTTVLIGRDGIVRYIHMGYERGYEQTYLDQVRALLKE